MASSSGFLHAQKADLLRASWTMNDELEIYSERSLSPRASKFCSDNSFLGAFIPSLPEKGGVYFYDGTG
jgi:hypothetical protein